MDPETTAARDAGPADGDLDVRIDQLIVDLGDGEADDESMAREITAAILASLERLELEA